MNSGIYRISNTINGKYYIGSTKDFNVRFKTHLTNLKLGKHVNKHLQASYNKYGKEAFIIEPIEFVENFNQLYNIEQQYLDKMNKDEVYNKTFQANGGGADKLGLSVLLLDLKGNIISRHRSLREISKLLDHSQFSGLAYNSGRIIAGKYRIVTIDYYKDNLDVILSWKKYTSVRAKKLEFRSEELERKKILLLDKDLNIIKEFESRKVAGIELNITREGVRKILVSKKYSKRVKGYLVNKKDYNDFKPNRGKEERLERVLLSIKKEII